MYKVLPSMRRLAAEILREYSLTAYATVAEAECALAEGVQAPYYILKLWPNEKGWEYLSIRAVRGGGYSKSYNNTYAVVIPADKKLDSLVLPSWRGHLVPWRDLGKEKYRYYIKAGYMPTTAAEDFVEAQLIRQHEEPEWLGKRMNIPFMMGDNQ